MQNEPVDVNSDADGSMSEGSSSSPASDIAPNGGMFCRKEIFDCSCLQHNMSCHLCSILYFLTIAYCIISVPLNGHMSDQWVDESEVVIFFASGKLFMCNLENFLVIFTDVDGKLLSHENAFCFLVVKGV